jgi:hypothetical protein
VAMKTALNAIPPWTYRALTSTSRAPSCC